MRSLAAIEADFIIYGALKEPDRTKKYVELMNELEANYRTFIFNPSKEDMERPEVKLYREISRARDL